MKGRLDKEDQLALCCPDSGSVLHADCRGNVDYAQVRMKLFLRSDLCKPLFARSMEEEDIRTFLYLCQLESGEMDGIKINLGETTYAQAKIFQACQVRF